MGTNYYLTLTCGECGRSIEKHIGKSSYGWCFTLRIYPEEGINTLDDWDKHIRQKTKEGWTIMDEEGDSLTLEELMTVITKRKHPNPPNGCPPPGYGSLEEFMKANDAVPGPNGLFRHAIDTFCVGHGEGTWDYVVGDFS